MSQCNFCSFELLKTRAKKAGLAYTTINESRNDGLGGVNIYVHPKNIDIHKLTESERDTFFQEWYMELGNKCEC